MSCLIEIRDWFWLKWIQGIIAFVGFVMMEWSILGNVVAELVEMSCYARDGSDILHPVMEDREQGMGDAGSKMQHGGGECCARLSQERDVAANVCEAGHDGGGHGHGPAWNLY